MLSVVVNSWVPIAPTTGVFIALSVVANSWVPKLAGADRRDSRNVINSLNLGFLQHCLIAGFLTLSVADSYGSCDVISS